MSLMGTLAKVAMGIAVAKGVGKMLGGGRGGNAGGSGGGLGDLLGGLVGGNAGGGSEAGGLGGILDSLGGESKISKHSGGGNSGGIGDLFNDALQGRDVRVSTDEDAKAKVLLSAMINAAKSDGGLDEAEQRKIVEQIGDVSEEEARFVRSELNSPLNTRSFINSVPRGMEQQVYLMSLLAIDLDSNEEAHYLDELAKGLNISNQVSNLIHDKVGAPKIYS